MKRRIIALRGKPMKQRYLHLLLCIIAGVSFLILPAAAVSGEKADGVLTVGVPADRCPIFYTDPETRELVGIGIDLMRDAASEAGYTVQFRTIEEETLKDALDNSAYDLLMPFGSAVESASGQSTIVSENLMQTPFTFVTIENKELPAISTLRVGMLKSLGAGIETLHQMFPDMKIMEYETMDDSVKALRAGEVDALLHNSYVWSYVLQKPVYHDLSVQPSEVFAMDFRAGTPDTPKGHEIIERLNDGITSMSDIQRQAVILDYTSRKLYQYDISDYLYQYGVLILLIFLLFIAVIAIGMLRIKNVKLENEEKLRQVLDHDPLTGVLSTQGFRKRVEELLRLHKDTPYCLSYCNIRNFKYINASLGRDAGDELLKFWAEKFLEYLSKDEAIGRLTADHFVILRRLRDKEDMKVDEVNVIKPVENFFIHQGKDTRVRICCGIYLLTPKDFRNINVDQMIDLARVAEQRARENRKTDYEFYNPEQWERGRQIAEIVNLLPKALADGDIQVWYQPQVDYQTGKLIGAEALCRWDHAKLGMLYPDGFITVLEDAGLIYELDCFVWDSVCEDLHRWNQQGQYRAVSVNVSRNDITEDRDIPELFRALIQKYDLKVDQLRIEITETAFAEKSELLIRTTEKLKSYGFKVEMDDFGSGYSSLHMLKEVPVDRIKLDLHFLTGTGDQEKGRKIITYIIQMVHSLGLELIAEGVETKEQAEFLKQKGCSEMQGYYFYRPMPVHDFEEVVRTQN